MDKYEEIAQKYQELVKEIKSILPLYKQKQKEFAEEAVLPFENKLLKLTPPSNLKRLLVDFFKCDTCNCGGRASTIDYPEGNVEYIYIESKNTIIVFGSHLSYEEENELEYYIYPIYDSEVSLFPIFTRLFDLYEKEIEFEITSFETLLTHSSDKFRKFACACSEGL